jgi:hypothetical protein
MPWFIYNQKWIGKLPLSPYAITLGLWVFVWGPALAPALRRHETVHVVQWSVCTLAAGLVALGGVSLLDWSPWWMLGALLAFPAVYGLGWLVGLVRAIRRRDWGLWMVAWRAYWWNPLEVWARAAE